MGSLDDASKQANTTAVVVAVSNNVIAYCHWSVFPVVVFPRKPRKWWIIYNDVDWHSMCFTRCEIIGAQCRVKRRDGNGFLPKKNECNVYDSNERKKNIERDPTVKTKSKLRKIQNTDCVVASAIRRRDERHFHGVNFEYTIFFFIFNFFVSIWFWARLFAVYDRRLAWAWHAMFRLAKRRFRTPTPSFKL